MDDVLERAGALVTEVKALKAERAEMIRLLIKHGILAQNPDGRLSYLSVKDQPNKTSNEGYMEGD